MGTLKSLRSSAVFTRQGLLRLATARSDRAYRTAFILLAVCVVLTSVLVVKVGSIHHNGFGHDTPVLLDGAWRILHGQRPHTDFYTPLGAINFLIVWLGMIVAEPSANSVAYGTTAFFIIMTLLAWWIARWRMSAVNAWLCALLVGFVIISPHPLGFDIIHTSYAMIYNRYGFGVLTIVLVELFLPAARRTRRKDFLGGLSTGALVITLFFLKYTYFTVAIGAICIKLLFSLISSGLDSDTRANGRHTARFAERLVMSWRDTAGWFYGALVGAVCVFVPMMIFLRFDLAALLRDVQLVARTRGATLSGEKLWGVLNLRDNIIAFVLLLLFWLLLRASIRRAIGSRLLNLKIAVIVFSTVVFGLLLILTNYQWGGMPLLPAAALIVWELVARFTAAETEKKQSNIKHANDEQLSVARLNPRAYLCSWFFAAALIGQVLVADVLSVGYSAWWHFARLDTVSAEQRFESKQLRDLIVRPWAGAESCNRASYPGKINEAMSLIKPRLKPDSRVLLMDNNNPLSFGLGLPSPRGDALYWHYGTHFNSQNGVNFTEQYHLPPERVFSDATIVMVPKCPEEWETVELMLKIYRGYVLEHYRMETESYYWVMMVKR